MWTFLLLGAVGLGALGQTTLVLYSSGLALVEETRRVDLAAEGVLTLSAFPRDTLWESLEVEGLEVRFVRPGPAATSAWAQLLGQEVTVQTRAGTFRGILREVLAEGLLLETEEGAVLVREYVWLRGPGYAPVPQALLGYRAAAPGERDVRFRYLARGFAWKAVYDAELLGEELRLVGKAMIQNETGRDFHGARIVLVAGEVRAPRPDAGLRALAMAPEAAPAAAFEYQRYDLPGVGEVPQGLLVLPLVRTRVPARKLYRFSGQGVEVRVRFTAASALPEGEVRLYAEGIFAGADALGPTPAGAEVELLVGTAFDLTGSRAPVRRERLGEDLVRETWRILLRSAKAEDVVVEVVESLSGYWRILSSTAPYEVLDAQRVKFAVPVPKGGEAALEYTVEWRY
ncbi:MAG: hypothetical protein NZ924_03115 [Candidatus Bipolaricaulota bacterium]|nr:hypothetical protein [Candidatus Bipolaricaulota bacterium]MDW8151897.1 hypothetical protein [Candidatus Bipolaricaulota bacterium]